MLNKTCDYTFGNISTVDVLLICAYFDIALLCCVQFLIPEVLWLLFQFFCLTANLKQRIILNPIVFLYRSCLLESVDAKLFLR